MIDDINSNTSGDIPETPGALKGIQLIRLDCQDIDFAIEADAGLTNTVQLLADSPHNAPTLDTDGEELVIVQRGRYRSGALPAVLRIPTHDCPPLVGKHDKGDLSFSEVNTDVTVKHATGDLRMGAGTGAFQIEMGKGDIHCSGHTGNIAIKSGQGDVHMSRCHGNAAISLGKGDIQLEAGSGKVAIKSGSGDVVAVDYAGPLALRLGAGDVIVNRPRAQSVAIKSGSGDVVIKNGSLAGLAVQLGKGDIISTAQLLMSGNKQFSVSSDHDDPDAEDDHGTVTRTLRTRGIDFEVGDHGVRFALPGLEFEASDAGVRISKGSTTFSAGDAGVHISTGDSADRGTFNAETNSGDITMDIPAGTPVRVEALVNGGNVRSDIPLVSVGRPGPRGSVQRYVGVSDPNAEERLTLRVKSDRGDIRLRTTMNAPSQPTPPAPPTPPGRIVREPIPMPAPVNRMSPDADTQSTPVVNREQRMRTILDDLARGAITIEEADQKLAALDRETT